MNVLLYVFVTIVIFNFRLHNKKIDSTILPSSPL